MATNLSENFTLEELIESPTAKAKKIDNTPTETVKNELKRLCKEVLQPIRNKYGHTLHVNSGYRCPKLNAAVGGAKTSQHMYGQAADLRAYNGDNKALFNFIKDMIDKKEIVVGQLIDEYNYRWVHVSSSTPSKKNQILHIK